MSVSLAPNLTTRLADFGNPADGAAILTLLDAYAQGETGTGEPLAPDVRLRLLPALKAAPGAFSVLALDAHGVALGLANCFVGLSTFVARPLINIHDLVVAPGRRGQGIGKALMRAVEDEAIRRGACKITLEVLSNNAPAKALYTGAGFGQYALNPDAGTAQFWEKKL